MLLTIALTFIATSGLYVAALLFACWRVGRHLSGDGYATNMVVEHVILPVLGRKKASPVIAPEPTAVAADVA
jgi:hypothetical protein